MVVSLKEIKNKFFSSLEISSFTLNMTLPSNMNMDMDNHIIFSSNIADNYDKVRGHSLSSNKQQSKITSMFLSEYSVNYTARCKHMNNLIDNK